MRAWRAAAKQSDETLSEWIRASCNLRAATPLDTARKTGRGATPAQEPADSDNR